ncbi:hypothetical protein SAMN05444920_106296 [Nonomuraea solani]|uniref:Uncharacterized protein n=1 Tax=Nonomuraea solani TaxID=1144553 RepID=A0A1H6DTY4_9ACTN|nr:hypothetical protein [Nonomuraea solani]SEG88738.1 hypothetical protein SAMN05444920_106296 [Nonomuraea solani]
MTSRETIRELPRGSRSRGRHARAAAPDPVKEFARGLRELRAAAGNPSHRAMKRRTGHPAAELAAAASGDALPSLEATQAYVTACGGDQIEWTRKWHVVNTLLRVRQSDRVYETVEYPRVGPAPEPPPAARRRTSIKTWVIVGVLAQIAVPAALLIYQNRAPMAVSVAGRQEVSATTSASARPVPRGTKAAAVKPAFIAVAGPGCPRDAKRSVRIDGLPGRDGWKDASVPGWTGAGCGDGFLFSELTYDATKTTHPSNSFQWRFTTGLDGRHQCYVGVYIPKTGFAGQRVWYTVIDGFDQDARTVAEFTLDQRMRQGKWVAGPAPVTITSGLAMVEITDTGKGNTTGDLAMVAGPVRLACL